MEAKYSKGMVFGVFDTFHEGHKYFLSQAKSKCRELVVVVTLPEVVKRMKNKLPKRTFDERVSDIRNFDSTLLIVPGDLILGEWSVLKLHKPDTVLVGYDQQGILHELRKMGIAHAQIGSHFPEKYKSSLLSA